jgi:hypothetical protein
MPNWEREIYLSRTGVEELLRGHVLQAFVALFRTASSDLCIIITKPEQTSIIKTTAREADAATTEDRRPTQTSNAGILNPQNKAASL